MSMPVPGVQEAGMRKDSPDQGSDSNSHGLRKRRRASMAWAAGKSSGPARRRGSSGRCASMVGGCPRAALKAASGAAMRRWMRVMAKGLGGSMAALALELSQ
jgi:hypothetical protein